MDRPQPSAYARALRSLSAWGWGPTRDFFLMTSCRCDDPAVVIKLEMARGPTPALYALRAGRPLAAFAAEAAALFCHARNTRIPSSSASQYAHRSGSLMSDF